MKTFVLSAFLQLIVFTIIPFILYLLSRRKFKGFWSYIGLKKSNSKANIAALFIALLMIVPILIMINLSPTFKETMLHPQSVTGSIKILARPLPIIIAIFFTAIFKTALAEEIIFRGFLAKRLISWLGFHWGNFIQAVLFGALHGALFYGIGITENLLLLSFFFLIPGLGAWLKVYVNEKMANGSIVPGWITHGTANVVSYSYVAFMI